VTIAFAVTALGLLSVFFLPQSVKSRLGTILEPEAVEVEEDQGTQWAVTTSAAASSQSRLRLLMDSLSVTASHPLLGVGPGNFAPYCAFKEQQKARPGFALWVGTHNTYTQVSSELGIPGLIFYLGILVASMRALHSFYRRGQRIPGNRARDIAYMALALHTSLVAFCVMCFFDHMAYEQAMPVIAAITVAMSLTVPDELKRLEEAARAADAAKGPNFPGASQGAARPGARVPGGRVPGARFEKSR
jgi:O-antigen ligase